MTDINTDRAEVEAPVFGKWLPIETAPKDGREVIIGENGLSATGFYSDETHLMRRAKAGWFFEFDRGDLMFARNASPTHWMPFPPPPYTD